MNLAIRIALIAILGSISQTYFPWWTAVVIAFMIELIFGKRDDFAFFSGFYGISIPWVIFAAYIDIKSESGLTIRVLDLLKMPQYSMVMVVLTGLIGGLAGGTASISASWIRALKEVK